MFSFSIRAQAVLAATLFCAGGPVAAQQKRAATPARATPPTAKNTNAQQALLAHEAEVTALLNKLTLEEKIKMVHANSAFAAGGIPRLGIPEVMTSDGPHGVRPEQGRNWKPPVGADDASTYLPTNNTLAATWNPALGYAYGTVLGSEANARG